jgi:uncharacterized RDD family membrane protein YckC
MSDGQGPRLARFGHRAGAWVIDAVPHALVPMIAARVTDSVAIGIAAFFVTGIVWSILPEAGSGMTVGKRLFGIRAADVSGAPRIGLPHATVRWIVKYPVGGVLPVGYLWYFRGPSRRTWHDLAARTLVEDLVSATPPPA